MASGATNGSPNEYRASQAWFYWPVANLMRCIFAVVARVRVLHVGKLPEQGGFLLASNHVSHFDPSLLTGYIRIQIDWLAMSDLFRTSWSAKLFTAVGAISLDRNREDRVALRAAIQRLRQGRVVGIFPEGGIRDGMRSVVNGGPMQQGAAMLAVHSGMPVVPVVILGSERFYNAKCWLPWRRTPVWIAVGTPIPSPQGLPRDKARENLLQDMADAYVSLCNILREKYSLSDADMPHSPQQRMKEP